MLGGALALAVRADAGGVGNGPGAAITHRDRGPDRDRLLQPDAG
jgi:hypothetical protein